MATAGELGFELAPHGDAVMLYVEDHGKPMATAGMKGKLTVLNGADKSEADLTAVGANKLEAKGVKLGTRRQGRAAVTSEAKVVTVRFTVK